MKQSDYATIKIEQAIKKLFNEKGILKSRIEVIPETFDRTPKKGKNYYYYSGPLDEKTRDFCKYLLTIDKVISEDDIDRLTLYLNYDVLQYKGSYNCRHKWVKFRGKIITTPPLTIGQSDKLISKGIDG